MKIISKYKDYYDYYQGIFGMDMSKVYTRKSIVKNEDISSSETEYKTLTFSVGGTQYVMYKFRGKLYHTPEEMKKLDDLLKKETRWSGLRLDKGPWSWNSWNKKTDMEDYERTFNGNNDVPTDVNMKQREPVWLSGEGIPLLKSFGFHKILDAKETYIKVETFMGWLVDNPPLPDKQTNVGKIEGHGFDKKRSFRPNMKK